MRHRRLIATVEGLYPFPFDMLRYDQCFPHSEADSSKIEECQHAKGEKCRIDVAKISQENISQAFEKRRWESFCWKVVEIREP